jgi:predicted DCC family thiol-disulfide oxidoreductase YuxK
MCASMVKVVREADVRGDIEILPSQAPGVAARFPWIPAHAYTESIQLVGPGNQTWQGAAAVERLLTILPRGRWIAWIFEVPFVRAIAERLYRWVARNRYRLGCGDHCRAVSS